MKNLQVDRTIRVLTVVLEKSESLVFSIDRLAGEVHSNRWGDSLDLEILIRARDEARIVSGHLSTVISHQLKKKE